jgi:hypothetical protein
MQQVEHWMAIFHSSMKPVDHIELPIMDAFRLKREVEFIDLPQHVMLSFVQCVVFLENGDDGAFLVAMFMGYVLLPY